MGSKKKNREATYEEPVRGSGRDRLEAKRRRFAEDDRKRSGGGLKPTTIFAIGGVVAVVVIVFALTVGFGGAQSASASVIQQASTDAATVANGKVSIPVDEVKAKKIVYWDYNVNGKKVPLMAYVTPSGAVKMAVRICEPCNGFSFRIEGNKIICNVCGTQWDLETLKGISGGCQGYPPDFLSSTIENGNLTVDEAKVTAWKARL